MKTADEFLDWLARAGAGERTEYYRGSLAGQVNGQLHPLSSLRRSVQETARKGLVALTQLRHGPDSYSYIATRLAEPDPELTWPQCWEPGYAPMIGRGL